MNTRQAFIAEKRRVTFNIFIGITMVIAGICAWFARGEMWQMILKAYFCLLCSITGARYTRTYIKAMRVWKIIKPKLNEDDDEDDDEECIIL